MESLLQLCAEGVITYHTLKDAFVFDVLNERSDINIRSVGNHGRLNIEKLSDRECKLNFRFFKDDIMRLTKALSIPDYINACDRHKVTGVEGLCIVLRRLAYPNRLCDLEEMFGLSAPSLSLISKKVIDTIMNNKGYLLKNLNNLNWLTKDRLEYYAMAIHEKGAPLDNCWAFIDGTARAICRPSIYQNEYYSGHKRIHCLKYQSVLAADGIIVNIYGPCKGRRHDSGILRDSDLYKQLQQKVVFDNKKYVLYGDSGYPLRELLLRPYPDRNLNAAQQCFNKSMSSIRQPVEWGFGKVVNEFAFLDFRKNQKLFLQDVGNMYLTACLLTNCHTCLYGSQAAEYFGVSPPSLEEYLQVQRA